MREIRAMMRRIVRVVRVVVSFFDPDWLVHQLAGRLQVKGIQLLWRDIVIRIERQFLLLRLFCLAGMTLIDDVTRAYCGNCNCYRQHELNFLFRFRVDLHMSNLVGEQ